MTTRMQFAFRREDIGFLERAARIYRASATVAAPPAAVFTALAEPAGWPRWFPGVRSASYTTAPPHGVGTLRTAHVGSTDWLEEMIAWEAPARFAWTVLRASVPLAHAQVESFDLAATTGGTEIRWTLALQPRLLGRLGAPFTQGTVSRLFRRAMHNLDTCLASGITDDRRGHHP